MGTFGITFVEDEALAGHDFAFVITEDSAWGFYRESTLSPQVLEEAWHAMIAARTDTGAKAPPRRHPYMYAV
jgi:hypothetical protein